MKVFWLILGICMLAGAVLVYSEVVGQSREAGVGDASAGSNHGATATMIETPAPKATPPDGTTVDDERAALAEELLASSSQRETAASTDAHSPASADSGQSSGTSAEESSHASTAATGSGTSDTDAADSIDGVTESTHSSSSVDAATTGEAETSSSPSSMEAGAEPEPEAEPNPAESAPAADAGATLEPASFTIEAIKGTTLIESTFARKADGSLLADDRYVVRGEGTKEKPFEISWDMLISASQSYQPRLGETALPGRIALLHEKYVRITGYLAFPVSAESFDEMLVMLNQWDGCCIGVPPSPYDAIEVKLAEPINMKKRHMFVYGTVEGRLLVEPYLINEWLVGLYLMKDAKVELDY